MRRFNSGPRLHSEKSGGTKREVSRDLTRTLPDFILLRLHAVYARKASSPAMDDKESHGLLSGRHRHRPASPQRGVGRSADREFDVAKETFLITYEFRPKA